MAIHDQVRIGIGGDGADNIPVYKLREDGNQQIIFTHKGAAMPIVVGGVKPGSIGKIMDHPIKVEKSSLVGNDKTTAAMGSELVPLFPIYIEQYKQMAWIFGDHFKII